MLPPSVACGDVDGYRLDIMRRRYANGAVHARRDDSGRSSPLVTMRWERSPRIMLRCGRSGARPYEGCSGDQRSCRIQADTEQPSQCALPALPKRSVLSPGARDTRYSRAGHVVAESGRCSADLASKIFSTGLSSSFTAASRLELGFIDDAFHLPPLGYLTRRTPIFCTKQLVNHDIPPVLRQSLQ